MSWTLKHSTDFAPIANTSAVSAGQTLVDGWVDQRGGVFSVNSGNLRSNTSDTTAHRNDGYLNRPIADAAINSKIRGYFTGFYGNKMRALGVRKTGNSHYGVFFWSPDGVLGIYTVINGVYTEYGSSGFTYTATDPHYMEIEATGTSPTVLTARLVNTNTSAVVGTFSINDSASQLQGAGVPGVSFFSSDAGDITWTKLETYEDSGVSSLVAGTLSISTSSPSSNTIASTAASGGVAPLTVALHRSTSAAFTPSGGTLIASNASFPYLDSGTFSSPVFYKAVVTDSASTTATSNQLPVRQWGAALNIGFIGDSISRYGNPTPAQAMVAYLKSVRGYKGVTLGNNYSQNGTTSTNWNDSSFLSTVNSAFDSAGCTVVNCMLGTNDSGGANLTPKATYKANMLAIGNYFATRGKKVVFHAPGYVVSGAASGGWDDQAHGLLLQYKEALAEIVNGTTLLLGDTTAFDYFLENQAELADGVHPATAGVQAYGRLWAEGVDRALNQQAPPQRSWIA